MFFFNVDQDTLDGNRKGVEAHQILSHQMKIVEMHKIFRWMSISYWGIE